MGSPRAGRAGWVNVKIVAAGAGEVRRVRAGAGPGAERAAVGDDVRAHLRGPRRAGAVPQVLPGRAAAGRAQAAGRPRHPRTAWATSRRPTRTSRSGSPSRAAKLKAVSTTPTSPCCSWSAAGRSSARRSRWAGPGPGWTSRTRCRTPSSTSPGCRATTTTSRSGSRLFATRLRLAQGADQRLLALERAVGGHLHLRLGRGHAALPRDLHPHGRRPWTQSRSEDGADLLVGGCDSTSNALDKLFADGSDAFLPDFDFCSIHYQGMDPGCDDQDVGEPQGAAAGGCRSGTPRAGSPTPTTAWRRWSPPTARPATTAPWASSAATSPRKRTPRLRRRRQAARASR